MGWLQQKRKVDTLACNLKQATKQQHQLERSITSAARSSFGRLDTQIWVFGAGLLAGSRTTRAGRSLRDTVARAVRVAMIARTGLSLGAKD